MCVCDANFYLSVFALPTAPAKVAKLQVCVPCHTSWRVVLLCVSSRTSLSAWCCGRTPTPAWAAAPSTWPHTCCEQTTQQTWGQRATSPMAGECGWAGLRAGTGTTGIDLRLSWQLQANALAARQILHCTVYGSAVMHVWQSVWQLCTTEQGWFALVTAAWLRHAHIWPVAVHGACRARNTQETEILRSKRHNVEQKTDQLLAAVGHCDSFQRGCPSNGSLSCSICA